MERSGYVGFSGVDGDASVNLIYREIPESVRGSYKIAAGVLASSVTLGGRQSTSHPLRNPPREQWKTFPQLRSSGLITLLHYHSMQQEAYRQEIQDVISWMGNDYHGMQLNNPWLDVGDVAFCRSLLVNFQSVPFGDRRLVLQINEAALRICDHHPQRIAERVAQYEQFITDILVDPSAGLGKPFDPIVVAPILRAIRLACPTLGLGVAGRLGPDSAHSLAPLLPEFFGILNADAESQLRTESDRLHLGKTVNFLTKTFALLQPAS